MAKGGTETKNISQSQKNVDLKLLKKELKELESEGIPLWLNGSPSCPKSIIKAHKIAEDGVYMRDYVANEKGEITRIDFDLIRKSV